MTKGKTADKEVVVDEETGTTKADVLKEERAAEAREAERAETEQIVRAARIRMERGGEKASVPVADVKRMREDGWVISGNQD